VLRRNDMLYRVLSRLLLPCGLVYEVGTVGSLEMISSRGREMLLSKGAISEVKAPPLSVLEGRDLC